MHRLFVARQEMGRFVSTLSFYFFCEVIEVGWNELLVQIKKASDLDVIIASHRSYLAAVSHKMFLNSDRQNVRLLDAIKKVLHLIVQFVRQYSDESLQLGIRVDTATLLQLGVIAQRFAAAEVDFVNLLDNHSLIKFQLSSSQR